MPLRKRNSRGLAIIFIFLLVIIIVSSKEILLDYPSEVSQEFDIKLILIDFPDDSYEVKLDIIGNGERIAHIFNGNSYQSTYYFVEGLINDGEGILKFKVVSDFEGAADISVKIRDSKDRVS